MNMQKPVAMPAGGMRIFFRVTGVWPSRMRQMRTATAPKMEVTTEVRGDMCMARLRGRGLWGSL
jgi:hypothetical protein